MTDDPLPQTIIHNYIHGQHVPPTTKQYLPVLNPTTSTPLATVPLSTSTDVTTAIHAAHAAFPAWSGRTVKSRAGILHRFHALLRQHAHEFAECIVRENGKNITEALADVAKGNETVEYACSLPQLMQGKIDRVSGEVSCRDRRDALGVVVSVVPFNFPLMVPLWTLPIAVVTGNTIVLKPSEKVPMTMNKLTTLFEQAGFPPGVINLVHGTSEAVEALIDHPLVQAVTFVGSSPIARLVSERCHALHKRCIALGGAKNHLVALPDCHVESAAADIVVSYAGCAGQRCMAASVLLVVGGKESSEALVRAVVEKASRIEPGTEPGKMGAVIDGASHAKILGYIEQSERDGAEILLDGRSWIEKMAGRGGNWIGPTIIRHRNKMDRAMREEIFGPVLSVYHVDTWQEAIEIENSNPFGNAAAIYTTNGGSAEWFCSRFRAAMLGVNIGIPVPREPFSFGGLYGTKSKYGDMDITGDGAIEFFTNRIKITTKWPAPSAPEYTVGVDQEQHQQEVGVMQNGGTDHANFAGRM
eukprot:CCRYP_006624-RA/>CCRYP_006624-RA protein AED:0.03 eAED:0.03 QI:221/1/1/1/0.66/0.5/4/1737/527